MGGNKKPRKKVNNYKRAEDDKTSKKEASHRGKNLIYIIIAMSIVGAGMILYFV